MPVYIKKGSACLKELKLHNLEHLKSDCLCQKSLYRW